MTDETKPTQPLLSDILEEMRSGFATLREEMHAGFAQINARLDKIEKRLKLFDEKVDVLTEDILEARRRLRLLDERMSELERKRN
jgi:septation ring formation regulator EzrA